MSEPSDKPKSRVVFDWTINLGHVLTFIGFMGAGVAAWSNLDKRVVSLEEFKQFQAERDNTQDAQARESRAERREQYRDINDAISRLGDKIDRAVYGGSIDRPRPKPTAQ
jgi:hypothetical protein